jgi:DHA1 family florfenicol/chloramphenicol resistance protein-like MFS transporter
LLLMAPFDILASLAMDIYLPVVPAMPGILGTTPATIQLTLSLYMLLLGIGQLVFGPLSDRLGRRPVLIGGAVLFTAASLGLAVSGSAATFLTLRIVQAAGASAALVATFATVRDVYAERPESAVIYSLFGSMLAFVPALGPIAGALIAEVFGWQGIFATLGLLSAAATLHALFRWVETRPVKPTPVPMAVRPILQSPAFWTYTLGFSAAMGSFFVYFSTAPRILIGRANYSGLEFSLAFATAALVMIVTARWAKTFVDRWGIFGSLKRGMLMLLAGAALLSIGQIAGPPGFWSFVLPMWVIAIGIVFAASVTANGALAEFGDMAGTAVALYFCIQSLITSIGGTLAVMLLGGDSAWPLAAYCAIAALVVLAALRRLSHNTPC